MKEKKPQLLPVRPGMFLETVTKVLGGMYETKAAGGVTFQQLEWVSTILLASWLSVHIDTLKNLRPISIKFHISVLHKWNSFCGYWDLWVDIFFSV
jgi:hypothetical protein